MSEVDWSKAPEGATHWGPETGSYYESFYKHSEDGWMAFNRRTGGAWNLLDSPMRDHRRYALIKRPVDVWSGEGLPPVGAVCEFNGGESAPEDPWHPDLQVGDQVEIIAHFDGGNGVVLAAFTFRTRNPDVGAVSVEQGNYGCFRPLRTPEQIAAEERLHKIRNAFTAIAKAIAPHQGPCGCEAAIRVAVEAMIDAGYRKVEGGAA